MDKTLQIAKWLYDNCPEFSALKPKESWNLTRFVMVISKLYLTANGMGELIPHQLYADRDGPGISYLEEHRSEIHRAKPEFDPQELRHLKIILRRFAYTSPAALKKGLMAAKPFSKCAALKQPRIIQDSQIPEDILKAMQFVHAQFQEDSLNYTVIKVNGRNFFADPGFTLEKGDYDDIVRAIKSGLFEEDTAYRLARDPAGNLMAY